ncbi:uncharacterized protein B0I36DRAFT_363198 [Microdochium trichocladiopsis]|uniref:Uncharacterized protein n=1 Tax=Microdochium trichocladiopsis TaxID=1682393 RepID=A0A9P9BNR8_9PEZI|nr:uncharacterized protein B0I36DRAFT_363198 [Microdochium trichocladiopsis]KAH7031516.1 hypothetical protein B0I36DRAFT_363198 [Microdochium trichocladiopsis]
MRVIIVALASLALWVSSTTAADTMTRVCNNCTNESTEPFVEAPPPWNLEAEVAYVIPMLGLSNDLPVKAYSPLERNSTYATSGSCLAGIGLMMIIRYKDSPVGPYDEFIIIPGLYSNPGDTGLRKFRISRIYVSHKYTTWNGRRNWNIPKHIARFDWSSHADGTESVKIYPHDTTSLLNEEAGPSELPFFQGTFTLPPIVGLVRVPLSTAITTYLDGIGLDVLKLSSPPLPQGNGKYGELVGTSRNANTQFGVSGAWASVGSLDVYQGPQGDQIGSTGKNAVGDEYYPNFWPNMPRHNLALRLHGSTVSFGAPDVY